MGSFLKTLLCTFGMCLCVFIQAQPTYTFTHYTSEDGLSKTGVNDILQDRKGFMWMATWNGLTRFDGHTFYNYKDRLNASVPAMSNRIVKIEEDSLGIIWILDYNSNMFRFDPKTEQVVGVCNGEYRVRDFYILPGGRVWFSTYNKGLIVMKFSPEGKNLISRNVSDLLHLPYNYKVINAITSDKDGNNWILTDRGVYKYSDKGAITNFFEQKHFCSSMIDDGEYLYFALENGQVWKYDKKKKTHSTLLLNANSQVTALSRLQGDELFCGTRNNGFFIVSTEGKEKKHYTTDNELSDNWIKQVHQDSRHNLWIHQKNVGVTYYDTKEDKVYRYNIQDKNGKILTDGRQKQMVVEDGRGTIFVHPIGGGLGYFDKDTRKLVPVYNKQLMDGWGESDMIMTVYADRQGNIWLGSNANGLEKITSSGNTISLYAPEELQTGQEESRTAFIDRENRLWVGFRYKGIGVYNADNHQFLGYLQKDGTLSKAESQLNYKAYFITQDHAGNIWIGTKAHGVMRLRPKGVKEHFELSYYETKEEDNYSLSNNDVFYIYEDSFRRLWFLTLNGGPNYLEEGVGGTVRFINHRNQLSGYPIDACFKTRSMVSDRQGHLWLATGDGILVFNEKFVHPSEVRYAHLRNIPGKSTSLSNNDVQSVCLTSRKEIYATTFGGGLNKLLSYKQGIADFKVYTEKEGLLSNVLFGIQEDREGSLWMSTVKGLCKFNPSTEAIENYSEQDLSVNVKFNEGAASYWSARNTLVFNTSKGPVCFNSEQIYKSSYCPAIVFTGLQVNDLSISPQDDSGILEKSIDDIAELTFTHLQNSFGIRFAALDMNGSHRIQYKYRLSGFEEDWKLGDTAGATYTNLPQGNYILEVISTNSDGVWMDNLRKLPIRVLPSFWTTPWAWILYVLVLTGGFIVYSKVKKQKNLKRLERLEEDSYESPAPQNLSASILEEAQQTLIDTIATNDQIFMKRLLDSIYKHLDNGDLKIDELAQEIGMNRAIFFNKVKTLTGLAPVEFLKDVRLKQAAKLIKETDLNMSQVAFQVGFNDAHYFSKCFKRQFGITPTEYKESTKSL